MTNLNTLLAQIATLSFDEQRLLNKQLVANLNRASKMKSMQNAAKFNVTDKVQFMSKRDGMVTLEISGFSRDGSNIKGKQIGGFRAGVNWTVAASLCSKV